MLGQGVGERSPSVGLHPAPSLAPERNARRSESKGTNVTRRSIRLLCSPRAPTLLCSHPLRCFDGTFYAGRCRSPPIA